MRETRKINIITDRETALRIDNEAKKMRSSKYKSGFDYWAVTIGIHEFNLIVSMGISCSTINEGFKKITEPQMGLDWFPEKYVSVGEASQILNVSETTVMNLVRSEKLTNIKVEPYGFSRSRTTFNHSELTNYKAKVDKAINERLKRHE